MASGGAEEDDGGIPLDIDNVHMLLQVEHEQIQKRTFTNWINAQLAKRCPPSFVSDLFSDLKDGSRLLDLLEVMSGQSMKRQRGHGVFQQRANIETALSFLKKKSIKLVNINIPDIIDGRPSIVLGLVWTIILRCHIEELASALSFSSRHSSLDSLASLDSWSGSPVPSSPVPAGRTSPLHRRFKISAKRALLMWVRDQCQRVGTSISVKDFKSSWRSGEAFLVILSSLRPQLVDLSLAQSRSNQENLEEAFHLAERELHIPRLLEPQDVDVKDPEEKSIMTYVAQFLQYSDMPTPDDHLQVSPSERAQEATCWLQQAFEELSEARTATENSGYAEKYRVFQSLTGSFMEQRRPVMTLLATIRRCPELSREQQALRAAWDQLEEELQRCKADLDLSLPPSLDSVVVWLQRAEAALTEEGGRVKDHAGAAKEARAQQDTLKNIIKEMSHHVQILDNYDNTDDSGNVIVPLEKFEEIKRRVTHIRVTAKYQGIKLEYQEHRLTVLDLLNRINAKIQTWKSPYRSKEAVDVLLHDWHETVERQSMLLILMDTLQNLKEKANAYTSKAALGEDSQRVNRQVKEAENEAESVSQAVPAVKGMMERVVSAWETYNKCLTSLQTWLTQNTQSPAAGTQQEMSEWTSCQAKLNEVGNLLIEVTETSTSRTLAEQLSKVNMQWAECVKRTKFEVSSEPSVGPPGLQMVHSLTQEASWLLRQPLDVASVPLKANRQKLQLLSKKMAEVDMSSLSSSPDFQTSHKENLQQTLPQVFSCKNSDSPQHSVLSEAERTCGELQRAASRLEGRLAELDHWSTDALDCYQNLKDKEHRGRSALDSTAKVLISRGSQLENQVVTEGRDLQDFVARVQKTSPLQHLSTSGMQDRISEAVSHGQEILGLFSSLGFKGNVGEPVHQTQRQPETGFLVVARAKHVDQTGNVKLQTQDPNQLSPQIPSHMPQQRTRELQDKTTIVIPHVKIQMLPQPLKEPVPHFHSSLSQSVKEAEPQSMVQPQSFAQASSPSQNDQPSPSSTQTAAGPISQKSLVLVLSKHITSPVTEGHGSSPPSQTHKSKSRIRGQQNTLQVDKTSPLPPVVVRSEVHSKAQSMARSRLEKARVHLHGRIQQAIKLFGGREISESQAKKKQRALKILQPVILDEFLDAVEGYGAFCSGPQLQDLMLLSDSVRKQWEDVRREMAAFVPMFWSQLREGKQPFSVVQSPTHTNALREASDQTDLDSLQQQQQVVSHYLLPQAAIDGAASAEQRDESLRELCETVAPGESSCLATEQLNKSDEAQDKQTSDAVLPAHSRGRQPGGNTPLGATGVSAETHPSSGLRQTPSADSQQQDLSPAAGSVPLHGDILPLRSQDVPTGREEQLAQQRGSGSGKIKKSSLRAQEQRLKARLLNITESNQQAQTHIQAVVRGDTVEAKQEPEWTVIPEAVAPPQEEHPSEQEVLERYRKACLVFKSQLKKNEQHLLEFIPEQVTISTLHNQRKQLQTLKQVTETLWFKFELQYAHLSHSPHLMTREDRSEVERDWEQLSQEWRGQQICLQNRMTSLENTADLMESADETTALITQKLDGIIRQSMDISSLNLTDRSLQSDLKEMDDRLQSEVRKITKQSSEEERQHPEATSLHQALHNSVSHLKQLRQQLEKVQSAAQAVDHFLATVREVKAEIPALLAKQDDSRQQNEADWEQERRSWQAEMQQRLQTAADQCESVDSNLKAAGMTLTMDGATATCQDVVTSLSEHVADVEKKLMRARKRESKYGMNLMGTEQMQRNEELNPTEMRQTKTGDDSPQLEGIQEQEHPSPTGAEEESGLEAQRRRLDGENDKKAQREEEHKSRTWRSEGDGKVQRRGSRQIKKEGEEKESLVQRRAALLAALREMRGAAEHLGLQELTLPALQQRTRALKELESRLAGLLPELQHIQDASSSGSCYVSQTSEVKDVWEETTKAVTERLEQCRVLTELLKRFQSVRGELTGTLQRAESTISEQASYMGKDNLQRFHTKVQERKAELNSLGDGIEEVRSVCRQLHSHLRQIPECTIVPFESEADALMDSWLDISERTDSHLENVHLGLTLWDGVLQLGAEVESWTENKLAVFAQSPSFQSEGDIKTLQKEIVAQEKSVERFQQRATEIQSLLQSTEPPLELQVAETQMKKKIEQLKELGSEAEDVYRQMVAAKGQITARMGECFNSLQKIQDSLLTLAGSDVAAVLAKLKDLCRQLQTQDEQAESLLEDLRVLTSITSADSLETLCADGIQLQEKVRNAHDLFSDVEEQTQRSIQDLDRLQKESEHLEQWLQAAEVKARKGEDLGLLQEEALKQRVRTELLSQLVSSLQSSSLQQSALVEESSKLLERSHNFHTNILHGAQEKQCSLSRDLEVFQVLLKSTQSWVGDLRLRVDSPLGERHGLQSPVEQRLHRAQAVVSATTDGAARLEELRVTGNSLSHRLSDGDDLKQEIQETIQKIEEQWRDLQQSVEPYHRVLQTDPEVTSSHLSRRQEVGYRVEELQRQIAQLPTLFPWPGTAERRQACLLARQLWDESKSLQLTLTSLTEQRRDLAERTSDNIWADSSWVELDTYCLSLMAELTALLQEVTDMEKDTLQLVTLKDSITDSATVEAQASLSQQVSILQNHKRALDSSIRENLALRTENNNQRDQQVKEEVSCVQTAVKDLAANVGNLCGNLEVLPDISQLRQEWCAIQDFDTRLTELAARVYSLQNTGESSITQDVLPADVTLTVDGVAKDVDSLRSIFLQRKQECAENTANRVRQVVGRLQQWSQTVQAEPSSPSQAALDEGCSRNRKYCEDINASPKKVFTIVLDMEFPLYQPQDMQQRGNVGASRPDPCGTKITEFSRTGLPEKKSESFSTLIRPKAEETDLKGHSFKSNVSQVADSLSEKPSASKMVQSASAKLSCKEKSESHELMHNDVLNSSKSCCAVAECQLTGAHAADTTFPNVKQGEVTGSCHTEKQTMSSVLCAVESSAQTGGAITTTHIPAGDNKQVMVADAAESTGTGYAETAEAENTEEASDPEGPESVRSDAPERQENTSLRKGESESKLPAALEDKEVTQGQRQMQEDMEPERTTPGLSADWGAGETTGGSTASCKHRSTMLDILSEIQSLAERSNIINRTPHIDLNWYLKSSPGEPEIRLMRTVQQVLACRYQPAQLDVAAMAKQLEEAEVCAPTSVSQQFHFDSISNKIVAEGQWSAALLDASATVQVKAAQLDQKRFGSSAVQADKLHALLQTMEQKKSIMEELLHLSGQLSVHLSDAESSGALLAQLGDVQEEWRLLEGGIKRALQHATNSNAQSSLLIKEAHQLKVKVEALQKSNFQSNDSKSALEFVCLTTDLKLYNQLYLHLQSQSDALVHFSLGQKEKDEIQCNLQDLGSLLNDAKRKLDTSTYSCGGISSTKINKQLQDLIMWAKQAENHISIGKKLALFPEEARIQIVDMKKFQTDIFSQRSKMQAQVEEMKDVAFDMGKEESNEVLKTVEDLYEAIVDSLDHVLVTLKKHLHEREKLLSQLASVDAWLAATHATRDPCAHVENVSKADIQELESKLESHKLATVEIQSQLNLVEAMAESWKDMAVGLSPGESRYLVNRLSGLWTELDGLLAHEKATSWELQELIHERTSSDEELSTIQASLKQISADLDKQKFPLTQETLSTVVHLKHMLMENQCQVQELQHCHEAKRSTLLYTIGELQDRCKALSLNAFEQDKYLHLRRQMEESRDIAKEQIQRAKDKTISVGERFRLCQTLLVELPLVKTQCQEAGDQLEAIAQELYPSELNSERERIHCTVETLVSWEHSVTDDIKYLEAKLLLGLRFSSELPALIELFQNTRVELEGARPVDPEEKAIDSALRRYWVLWRNMESGMRVLEVLGRKEKINLKNFKELYSLRDVAMQECHLRMESLSQARESLKDYQWAAQGAIAFLHNAEATFLSAPGGFLDCTEEQRQSRQALEALEDGFQAHICHLVELVPQQPCLSCPKAEQLHLGILTQLLVGRAVLEAQAQLRLESLQSCAARQQSHRSCHEDVRHRLSRSEAGLSECAAAQIMSYDKCVAQQKRATLLMEDLRNLAGKIEELRAGCPMQGCGVGKDGELAALWRRWVSLRRGVGVLMAHAEQRQEEWKDITTSIEQCCSFLASLQAEVPDSSTVSFTQEKPLELLAQAEMHQAGLEQEQQALASLEHRLEHALSLSSSQDPMSPGPVGRTLVKIQENVRSLKERNLLVVAAAQAEEKERQQVQAEIGEVAKHMLAILSTLEACSNASKRQELREDLSSQRSKLKSIMHGVESRYEEIPDDISKRLQKVQLSLQRAEEKLMEGSSPGRQLAGRMVELCSGLEKVKASLEQKSPTVNNAQNMLKHVWDELDAWHSRLMILESEVHDLAEEQPDQAHLLMDQLTQPLQLHQNVSQMAEHRTAFLSKIPVCLQELQDILYSATCWMEEAQTWLNAPCSFTTARSLQNHASSLQLVLDDSERIRDTLQGFRPVLAEISAVCDINTQEKQLDQNDQQVHKMQRNLLEPLEQLLQAAVVVDVMEAELKTMEKNVPKIRTILSSMDDSNITLTEHLQNRQVILANVQSMQRTLEELEKCKVELHLPQGAEESLLAFSRTGLLLQPLEELEQLTQQQASLLENKIREEEETSKDVGITPVSSNPEERQQLYRSPQRHLVQQEAFEVSNSEEEEEEDDESCHSSSSDTLTCSIPEDPEETLNVSDVTSEDIAEMKPLSKVKELGSLVHEFSSEVETSSRGAESGLLSVKPRCDTNDSGSKNIGAGFITMDSKADVGDSSRPETLTAEPLISAVIPAAKDQFTAATKPPQAAAAIEDTRLIPARPIAPFTPTRESVLIEDGDRAGHEEDEKEQQRWSRLYTQIYQKLTTLKKVQQEHQTLISSSEDGGTHEKVPEKEPISSGSASAVLQWTHESITMLRQIVTPADSSHPGVKEELYEAARRVLFCLDSWTDLLLTPGGADEDDLPLRLLQQECVSSDLVILTELLNKVESETRPALSKEQPDAYHCLTCLQDCLSTVQLVFTSSRTQVIEHLGLKNQHQDFFKQLCILDEFELGQSETFPSLKDAPSLEQCLQGRHLRESPGEKAKVQQASGSLLQGITHLLELGEEGIKERQMSQVHNRSQLQAALCRPKRLLQVLRSQLAFVQHLFQREPEVFKCQEDERLQLEVRAKALQQQALEQEVASYRRLQEWTIWEDNCGQLGRVLDESEALISSGEPEGDDEESSVVQHRLDACQQTLVQLDDSRAALGLLLDQCKVLQTEPVFAASVGLAGGALELRWRSAFRRTEQEIRRCRDIQEVRARFQTDFTLVSNWLVGASKHLKTWSDLADTSGLNQECVHKSLFKLLDLSMEVEAMSVQRASVSREATQLLHLREADCPGLRAQIAQLEVRWSQLTSDVSRLQEQLHQKLLAGWPPAELLCDLEDWLKKLETRLSQEKETVLKAKDAAQITEVLLHYKELKAGIASGQLLLDFLCQSGPQAAGADIQALRSERTLFAETLGALRLQWLQLQRQVESQIHGAEQMQHTCAARERRLQHLHGWIEQQKKQLTQWEQPTSQTFARKALLEWEAVVGRVKGVAAALQELKATRAHAEKEEEHPCDITFWNQAESVSHACEDLSQQMEALRPALQQTVTEWSCFDRDLREVTLHTSRVRCALQHQQAPVFSLTQAEGHAEHLQQLQGNAGKGETLWAAVEKSFQSLMKTLHHGAAQALSDQMEGERKRWKDVVQELKDMHVKTGETLSLWQEYSRLSDNCSLHLQQLWLQWEELSTSSPAQDTQTMVASVEKLQVVAEGLQSSVGDVLEASKPLMGRLGPPSANLIQSQTRLLSRDVLLLCQAMSGKKKSLQDDGEEQKRFHTCLQTLEKQTQNIQNKLRAGVNDKDSVKQVLLELSDLFPSLVDVRETSGYLTLNNQERERLHMLSREWIESMTRISDRNRELQAERQSSQTFQEKYKNLMLVKEKLVEESMSKKPLSLSCLQEMLTAHQRLQAEIITGHQLLRSLLSDAVKSMEKETREKRSELVAQVASVKESWFSAVALACQRRSLVKEQLRQRRIYHHGLKHLWKLLTDVDPLLPPAGPALCTLQRLGSCADEYQCVEEALGLRSTVYNQTLEAGKHLCETMTESECQSRLQSELQAVEEAWKQTSSLLGRRRDLVNTTLQKWSQCQDGMTNILSELDEVKTKMNQQLPESPEKLIQETELSLQRLASGLRELGTMKTDLSQYITAGDSALLEQQLEQLHGQWEELCMKVSLRRQEIADRLNAWTIFNDKNKEFCDWLTQMENKVCHSGDLSIEEMVEKLKKDCMEEINLFSENKSHLKQLGEQLLLASDEAKQTQVRGSMQEVNQRWHNLFHHIEARVKKLKETLVTVQQLDKNMSNLRSWLSRIEAELSRPITYSVCHHQEIQRRLAEQQELQRDIEQHTEGVASVLNLCDVLLRDEDAAGGTEAESDSLQETSRSLDQRWRAICTMALDRRLRIEETWRLWCKFLDDYSRFEDWLKMAERTAANPNSADVLYTVAKEELKKFEGFQRQVHERLTQLELVNNQYRRLARENRTDRASQLKAMVHEGNRRWDTLHRRAASILRRLKYFTSQREEFEGTRESMLVWLTELDLQLTNVEHFSESDVHHKIQQLNSFQKEISLNTERIDGLIVFGEGLIQRSSPQDAALIEDELQELHTYCQEVFSRLVRFHQRLSQPPIKEEPELSGTTFSLESSLELIGRPWLGRTQGSLPATPTHLLASPLERSGRETPVSVDSLPLEWDHTGDVGGSSTHEDDEEEEERDEEGAYFSALSEVEFTESQEDFIEAPEALLSSSLVPSRSMVGHESPGWGSQTDTHTPLQLHSEAAPTLTSTPIKQGYLGLMTQCSGSIKDIKRVSLILDDEEQPRELGLTGLSASDKQSGVIERWELLQAQSRSDQQASPQEPRQLTSDLDDITSWLENVIPELDRLQPSNPAASIEDMEARAKELKEMQRVFTRYKSIMLSVNLRAQEAPDLQQRLASMNRDWSRACTGLQQWDTSLRNTLMRCQEFHETLHSLLLWLAHAESRRYTVDISHPDTPVRALRQQRNTLTDLQEELRGRQAQQASLQALWSQLQPEDGAEEIDEAQEKLHVTGNRMKLLLREVNQDLSTLQQRLGCETESDDQGASADASEEAAHSKKGSSTQRERRDSSPPRSFFYRVLRAAFPLHLLLLLLLLLPCLIPMSESDPSCTVANNFARSFYPMLRYTNGPPPT
ncbi:nesprin-2-like [Seriola aureovittata]|uniref:nesprin-2-like n=1 Tax=Seriola aureovittata TaxID=2871759 RepID=UPI0024BECFFB|nr:nesprin-2-like [Seriola aureovittata]